MPIIYNSRFTAEQHKRDNQRVVKCQGRVHHYERERIPTVEGETMNEAVWMRFEYVTGGKGFYFCSNCSAELHGGFPVMNTCHACGAHMLSDSELAERRKAYENKQNGES